MEAFCWLDWNSHNKQNIFLAIFKRKSSKIAATQKTTQKIIELIKENPRYTRKELAQKIGDITEDGVKYNLEKLKKNRFYKDSWQCQRWLLEGNLTVMSFFVEIFK